MTSNLTASDSPYYSLGDEDARSYIAELKQAAAELESPLSSSPSSPAGSTSTATTINETQATTDNASSAANSNSILEKTTSVEERAAMQLSNQMKETPASLDRDFAATIDRDERALEFETETFRRRLESRKASEARSGSEYTTANARASDEVAGSELDGRLSTEETVEIEMQSKIESEDAQVDKSTSSSSQELNRFDGETPASTIPSDLAGANGTKESVTLPDTMGEVKPKIPTLAEQISKAITPSPKVPNSRTFYIVNADALTM